jgi:hypothetical protein
MDAMSTVTPIHKSRVEVIAPNQQPKDDKYVVLKRSDLDELLRTLLGENMPAWAEMDVMSFALDDAVVIRTQDAFAGPALHSYAYTMSLVAGATPDADLRARLRRVADYFAQRAYEADEIYHSDEAKYPD